MKLYRNNEQPAESHITIWQMFASVVAGGVLNRVQNASQLFGHYAVQATPALNDQWKHPVYLKKGTYEARMIYVKATNGGAIDVWLDNALYSGDQVVIGTIDTWANPGTFSHIYSATISIPRDAFWTLWGLVSGKNASSGGYSINVTSFHFWRTGD